MDAAVYKKLTDIEKSFENPFGTKEGQIVVSESENFWQRMIREGHQGAYAIADASNLDTVGSGKTITSLNGRAGKRTILKEVMVSADTDVVIYVLKKEEYNFDSYGAQSSDYIACLFLKAGQPFIMQYNGTHEVSGAGGQFLVSMKPTTATGKGYACITAMEVALDV